MLGTCEAKCWLATDDNAAQSMGDYLGKLIKKLDEKQEHTLVFLCIGSDYYIGDSLGPLVGSEITKYYYVEVWGTMEYPVCANNLEETILLIRTRYNNPLVVCIDAGIGNKEQTGQIEVILGGLRPGLGVGQKFPAFGDISIIGYVNCKHCLNYHNLQNISLKMVLSMSKVIAEAIFHAYVMLLQSRKTMSHEE